MALFRKKKTTGNGEEAESPETAANGGADASFSPAQAAQFFRHARAMQDATNYDYALLLWIKGLARDPGNIGALESLFATSAKLVANKTKPSKDAIKAIPDGDVGRYIQSLLAWALRPADATAAVRAAEISARIGQMEPAAWVADRALVLVTRSKPRKDLYVKLKDIFMKLGMFDKAVQAGEAARQIDPTDGRLAAEIRNLSAQATMSQGGFDQIGEAGGFLANVRDLSKQRELEDADRIVKTEETIDRLVEKARMDYESRPEDWYAIEAYAKRLLERGGDEDEKLAYKLLMEAYKSTDQFRFRQMAGDIKLRRARRKVGALNEKLKAELEPDPQLQEELTRARQALLDDEVEEYKARVAAYPTDLTLKLDLGKRHFERGDYEEAIALFQESQTDPKSRGTSLDYLGRSFHAIGWNDEAIHTYRRALEQHANHSDGIGMGLRYGLLVALQAKAESDRDFESAEEAEQLASSIAVQQINYQDIRTRRDSLKKLIAELRDEQRAK